MGIEEKSLGCGATTIHSALLYISVPEHDEHRLIIVVFGPNGRTPELGQLP